MPDKAELAHAVSEAAQRLNWAMSAAADAGLLVEVIVDDDPERTVGATPYPKLTVKVHSELK
ncbi:MAG TPA: hypothetical protein VGB36_00120 [Gammaproteobacteria bacterium]|jgi:hypothetical protein